MFAAVGSQSLSELPSFPEERGMGRGNAFSSFPASELIHMEWQACPYNPGSLSPFPKASFPHLPCHCQALSRDLEASVYLVCVGQGSEPTMPDPILNSFVTSLYPGYKTVQQPLEAHSGSHAMLSAPEHIERHQITQPTLISRGVHILKNGSFLRNLGSGTPSLKSGLLNSEATLSAKWAHCLWVTLLPPFHYSAGSPLQTPHDKPQALAPPAPSPTVSHSLAT